MCVETLLKVIKEHDAKFVDLRFTDTRGKQQHVTVPVSVIDDDFHQYGKTFDGSSIEGWKGIQDSDLILMPDSNKVYLDPFYQDKTVFLSCNIIDPGTMKNYERDPRSLAQRAEAYLQSTGIADKAYFGPEPEFFLFDDVRWECNNNGSSYKVDSAEASWNSGKDYDGGNIGHRPQHQGGYFPLPPVDSAQDVRSAICLVLEEELGMGVEAHHHEVAGAGQGEVATVFDTLTNKADQIMLMKYVIHNVAHSYGKTATFMPKPIVNENGNGMHCHQSLSREGVNIFAGEGYAGLSENALYYIGGIIRHARSLNAFTNPSINSYKRLVPGFEAPVLLAYSARNRSASIRIPHCGNPKGRRIEVRFPDPLANPYLAFSAMMMAGLDGIQNKIHPGEPMEKDLYELPPEELMDVPTVCRSLEQSLHHLQSDQDYLLQGGVFTKDFISSYMALLEADIRKISRQISPMEFEMYYSG